MIHTVEQPAWAFEYMQLKSLWQRLQKYVEKSQISDQVC